MTAYRNVRSMRFWDGPLSPGENDRLCITLERKVLHPAALRPQHLRHGRPLPRQENP